MKQIGGVDEAGFYFLVTFDTKDSDDMSEMLGVLNDHQVDSTVKGYSEEQVEVIVRPDLDRLP